MLFARAWSGSSLPGLCNLYWRSVTHFARRNRPKEFMKALGPGIERNAYLEDYFPRLPEISTSAVRGQAPVSIQPLNCYSHRSPSAGSFPVGPFNCSLITSLNTFFARYPLPVFHPYSSLPFFSSSLPQPPSPPPVFAPISPYPFFPPTSRPPGSITADGSSGMAMKIHGGGRAWAVGAVVQVQPHQAGRA